MADEQAPDFTFDVGTAPDVSELVPLYQFILGPHTSVPTISLGAVTRAEAEAWLLEQASRYAEPIGKRSHLVKNIDLRKRVTLVGLADGDS